jgi:transaldolase
MTNQVSSLRLYIDSVDRDDWLSYLPTGIFYGVTTNPKLIASSEISFELKHLTEMAKRAFSLGANEIHIQVWGREVEKMLEIGRKLGAIDSRVMIKVPITGEGILCARQLIAEGFPVTLTALHGAEQILSAAALGARYAAPYLGRMNDGGLKGLEEVIKMQEIILSLSSPMRLLVASIRQISDLVILAEAGVNTFTLLPSLIDKLLENNLTNLAAASFQQAVDGDIV